MKPDEMIEVIRAIEAKKPIQRRPHACEEEVWEDVKPGDQINFSAWDFRIKPEEKKPREWLLVVRPDGSIAGAAIAIAGTWIRVDDPKDLHCPSVRVREVLE